MISATNNLKTYKTINLSNQTTMKDTRDIAGFNESNTPPSTAPTGNTHLLTIGINAYKNGIPTLNNAVRDAQKFEEIMKKRYGIQHGTALYEEAATLEGIIDAFDQLQKELTNEDNLIIYFSGHGDLVNDNGYWIPTDAKLNKRHTYLSNHDVRDLLKNCNARHVLVIVDACFSGALLNRSIGAEVAARYYQIPSRWVMTSGKNEPVPDGAPGTHSPFAKALLTQLAYFPKPYLSVSELWVNMREGVVFNSEQTPRCEPVIDADHQGGEFYFIDKNAEGMPPMPVDDAGVAAVDAGVSKRLTPTPSTTEEPIESNNNQDNKMTVKELKKKLRTLMTTGSTKAALELLVEKLDEDSSHTDTVYLRMANLYDLENDIAKGIAINVAQQKAQINAALDYIIKNLEEDDLAE